MVDITYEDLQIEEEGARKSAEVAERSAKINNLVADFLSKEKEKYPKRPKLDNAKQELPKGSEEGTQTSE